MDHHVLPLPDRPIKRLASPQVVLVLDEIRFALEERPEMGEFCWFAREYPRVYRHYFQHAEYRLHTIYDSLQRAHRSFVDEVAGEDPNGCFELAVSNPETRRIYWDFESYLSALSSSLDTLARICGTAFAQQTPVSFKDFCKKAPEGALRDTLRGAQNKWAQQVKDYRDCFIHYTPVDTILSVKFVRYLNGF
jgi:hypothetical protein